jgi:hypothetical protein
MIRLRTTRGGVRDIFTSRKANGRLLSAEVPQGGDAISDDGVLRFPLATVASETRRRDTLWLFLDASAGTSWLGATLAVFLDPATRSIARQSLDARPSEAEHAERELAALATSFDVLPIDHTATLLESKPRPSDALDILDRHRSRRLNLRGSRRWDRAVPPLLPSAEARTEHRVARRQLKECDRRSHF